jgi:hypothetical protein
MTDDAEELRRAIAVRHAIPERAAVLISGETVDELEESASKLAALIDTSREQEPEQQADPLTDALRHGPALKAARQRALIKALHRPQQRRDARGRFTAGSGFDGGIRGEIITVDQSPERAHDETIVEMAKVARTFGCRDF